MMLKFAAFSEGHRLLQDFEYPLSRKLSYG